MRRPVAPYYRVFSPSFSFSHRLSTVKEAFAGNYAAFFAALMEKPASLNFSTGPRRLLCAFWLFVAVSFAFALRKLVAGKDRKSRPITIDYPIPYVFIIFCCIRVSMHCCFVVTSQAVSINAHCPMKRRAHIQFVFRSWHRVFVRSCCTFC